MGKNDEKKQVSEGVGQDVHVGIEGRKNDDGREGEHLIVIV